MGCLTARPDGVEWRSGHETLVVRAWGRGVRVMAGLHEIPQGPPAALLDRDGSPTVEVTIDADTARFGHAGVEVTVTGAGEVSFARPGAGEPFLAEQAAHFWWPGARLFAATGNGYHRVEQRFAAADGERFYGLGQHTHGMFDQKTAVVDLVQRNGEVTIPFLLSSRGYGFLWNSPAVGRVELAGNGTRWVADSARLIDYWVTAGTPAEILSAYADATGRAPTFPAWASGFWQSKLRYRTQDELMTVAREYRRRGLPLSVIVCDFFHGPHIGDFRLDPAEWPDPRGMVEELTAMGVRLMMSVWPSVTAVSVNFNEMLERGYFVRNERGVEVGVLSRDKGVENRTYMQFYDPTNPAARAYVWERVKRGYHDHGVRVFWLDASEPEMRPAAPDNLLYHAGPGQEVGNLYPRENARMIWEGMREAGEEEILSLNRSAWAGSQRYGAAVWSGDIRADWDSLAQQLRAGLSMAVSGIPWWTTDIGGFHGGDPDSPEFRELMARWFQFGVFCPITRLHGDREPRMAPGPEMTGGPNEVWSFGPEVYEILTRQLSLRESLRPYIHREMANVSSTGVPLMRPLFVDYPDDPAAWDVADAYLFGPDLLVAPVLGPGVRERAVYLPAGADWRDVATGRTHPGGTTVTVPAPLRRIPVFAREGAADTGAAWQEVAA
ncbi:TIM-barrel domain-containing protein [Streptomyces sp. NPDC127098]|uniref:glycoside hydrolase family 31 protein n=1 Tax=Streptomyces sp. NPDC127098 TaxID=3347137 RepID=UPI00364770DE